jgi:hypothetical protein
MSGTSGGQSGTSGGWIDRLPILLVAGVSLVVGLINATSKLMEAAEYGRAIDVREPFAWEISSLIMVVALAPLPMRAVRIAPAEPGRWGRLATVHVLASTMFSALHIAGMVAIRKIMYAAVGKDYDFGRGDTLLQALYEWRKDLLTYAAFAVAMWAYDRWRAQEVVKSMPSAHPVVAAASPDVPKDERIEIRDGGRVVWLSPSEIDWVEAAGNYVEIHTGGAVHLARGTLAAFEARLGPAFARVHRSRLVNRARIKAWRSTPSGDFEITLDDGRQIVGSRRYRQELDTTD